MAVLLKRSQILYYEYQHQAFSNFAATMKNIFTLGGITAIKLEIRGLIANIEAHHAIELVTPGMFTNTGYKGRIAIMEALRIDDDLDEMIAKRSTLGEVRTMAVSTGYKTLADDAVRLILKGMTSLEEVTRVIDLTKRL